MRRAILAILMLSMWALSIEGGAPSLAIFTYRVQGVGAWDPDSVATGISGSEEAVIYVSQKLAALGYRVTVYGVPPAASPYSGADANPRYVSLDGDDDAVYDIAISWRMPDAAARLRRRARRVYLWPHDTYSYRLSDSQVDGFDDVLWLSQWQREQWSSVNPGFQRYTHIIGNGINPDEVPVVGPRDNPYACIYGSNYARGLEILLDLWPAIKQLYPKATLDIYYGWQHWGLLSPEKEAKMRQQLSSLADKGVTDHGKVGHRELSEAFSKASLWLYPCTYPEVFCITALRAQLSGAVPVVISEAALSETVRHGFSCRQSGQYLSTLLEALRRAPQIDLADRQAMGDFIRREYTWEAVARKWHELFSQAEAAAG